MIDYAIHNKCRDCDGGGFFFFFHFSLRKNGAKGIDSVSGKRERRDICEIPLHMSGGGGGGARAARRAGGAGRGENGNGNGNGVATKRETADTHAK